MTDQPRTRTRFLDCSNLTMAEAEGLGEYFAQLQRDIMFYVGDLARYAEHKWPEQHHQIWPEWVSPGLLARTAGVCRAYPNEADRQHEATYSQYMNVAGKPNRQELLAGMVGMTTDESRKELRGVTPDHNSQSRWLLAIDCNYFLHRFWHSGSGIESAMQVAGWIGRTVERLREKGLTDVACCFDSPVNERKELTKDWEDKYKDRPPKDPELIQQLHLLQDLVDKAGFTPCIVYGQEADDVMASYAKQFQGKVTLLTQDKDQRQCLSGTCNILLDVEWKLDEHSGDHLPKYQWYTEKPTKRLVQLRELLVINSNDASKLAEIDAAIREEPRNLFDETGLTPSQWIDYQIIMGDNVDGIRGVEGIGAKGAADLVKQFGSVDAVIGAAAAGHESIKPKKREAILAFASKLEVTRKLVTLRDDLKVPESTRLT